jgi:hypothetical protein
MLPGMSMSVNRREVGTGFQHGYRFVRVPGLNCHEAGFFYRSTAGIRSREASSTTRTIGSDLPAGELIMGLNPRRSRAHPRPARSPRQTIAPPSAAMSAQIAAKCFLGELQKVRSEAQALELKFAIAFRTRQDRINPLKSEVTSPTPALSLSVVQTTEPHHQ